ncbi:CPXCG motif-containing cysteine-rich protein [Pelagicoccus sp. NFK12]|uniref:CPXCG motif-containing cysteine-rich protein n=1 Tax=Pelagicoccus enzymogenes TaxID=2773457 RepID=A0A927IGT5_9BACT|nr:CPXCG motif-containing cysteine-rich protein [Pelagicoccus enzymogenes]MBD5779144.1 CPXCG motif-containing cysteine-rich protein [Pelagicoccus enzymogenes]MDQ8201047.1 CPXCG motif-containing cysteine-rich protein [Pelagicoccus enzymogenes]
MNLEQDRTVACPYCGEAVGVVINCTLTSQEFVEDCQVCCRPIQFSVMVDEDGEIVDLQARSEDE